MPETYDLVIYGCGGHARSVIDVLVDNKPNISICIIDDQAMENEVILGFQAFREQKSGNYFFLAIGDNYKRAKFLNEKLDHENLFSIISNKAHIGKGAEIAKGVFIGNFVHIGPEAVIGINSIINTAAIIEHEVYIGNHCHIAPNAAISGRSKMGDFVFVGAGATIIDSISVCSNVVIGAGAVVIQNITEPGTYVGCPAKRIK